MGELRIKWDGDMQAPVQGWSVACVGSFCPEVGPPFVNQSGQSARFHCLSPRPPPSTTNSSFLQGCWTTGRRLGTGHHVLGAGRLHVVQMMYLQTPAGSHGHKEVLLQAAYIGRYRIQSALRDCFTARTVVLARPLGRWKCGSPVKTRPAGC